MTRPTKFGYEGDFANFVQYNKPQVNLMVATAPTKTSRPAPKKAGLKR